LKPTHAVFVVEQNFSIDDEIDEYDDKAVFFLLNVINEDEEGDEVRTRGTRGDSGVKRKPVGTVRFVPGLNKVCGLWPFCWNGGWGKWFFGCGVFWN
jgi:hypothetical protein